MKTEPFVLPKKVYIVSSASVAGLKERKGPIGEYIDLCGDDRFGKDTWEKSEAEMQRLSVSLALSKIRMNESDLDVIMAGDLINQCISSSFGIQNYRIPFFGLFGACSTCAEGLIMSSVYSSTVCDRCINVTSSHYCTAERQFRYPLEYGGQRSPTSQWTVTGAGAFISSSVKSDLERTDSEFIPEIMEVMPGCIVDHGIKDANNMGAAMAPAAADTLKRYFASGRTPDEFDLIVTGDLGYEGSGILKDLLLSEKIDITGKHADCGLMIYDRETSDTHAGGSGCGCSAVVLSADILSNIMSGKLKDILFIATGALMNTMSVNQGQTIPAIAHLVRIKAAVRKDAAEA